MKKYLILITLLNLSIGSMAQKHKADTAKSSNPTDALLNSLSADSAKQPVIGFRSTRLILSQTTETIKKNTLNFQVIHRFGDFAGKNGGGQYFYGLDAVADVYIGFEYGITDNFNIQFGRSTLPFANGLVALGLKYGIMHQTTDGSTPLSITLYEETGVRPYSSSDFTKFSDRLSYFSQAIFSRQFGSNFTFQLAPGFVQDNRAYPLITGNDESFFSLSAAARLKVTKHMNLIVDYAHPFSSFRQNGANGFSDPLGFGFEVETGGHMFTLNVTNARAVNEINYLNNTTSAFGRGQYRIGFTISRIFDFNNKSTYK